LAGGVDAARAPAEEPDRAVGLDGGEVAGDRPAPAADHLEHRWSPSVPPASTPSGRALPNSDRLPLILIRLDQLLRALDRRRPLRVGSAAETTPRRNDRTVSAKASSSPKGLASRARASIGSRSGSTAGNSDCPVAFR